MTRITDMRSDRQAESSGSLFKLQLAGAGAYCFGPTTNRTAWYHIIIISYHLHLL